MRAGITKSSKGARIGRNLRQSLPVATIGLGTTLAPYQVRDEAPIRAYLASNPDVTPVLQIAPQRIREVFGPNADLSLETLVDPEGSSESVDLWIMVCCRDDVDDALVKLRKLDRDWTAQFPWPLRGKINVDVEFE